MGFFTRSKNNNKPLIRQIIDLVPKHPVCINKYNSNKGCYSHKIYDQFVTLTFGQLNKCLTLNNISTGIGVNETKELEKTKKIPDK